MSATFNVSAFRLIGAAVVLASTSLAAASPTIYQFGTTPASTFTGNFSVSVNSAGSLIGNYDAVTNAGGCRTLTGTFGINPPGPPTNQRIQPVTVTGSSSGNIASVPAGNYRLVLDAAAGTVTILGLSVNLIGTQQPSFPVNATITYPGFRTRTPNYTYFFLAPVPLPIGTADVSVMTATQTAPASGPATPAGGGYSFTIEVPMDLSVTAALSGTANAATVSNPVTVTGTITPGAGGAATATLSFTQTGTQPVPPSPTDPPPAPLPFDLPPPPLSTGPNAGILLSLLVTGGTTTINGTSTLPGTGSARRLSDIAPADEGGDGTIDGSDFIAFINAFAIGGAEADLVGAGGTIGGDGTVDGDDFIAFINDFAIG
jgi:hypothetical protein